MSHQLRQQRRESIRAAVLAGASIEEVATKYGLTPEYIHRKVLPERSGLRQPKITNTTLRILALLQNTADSVKDIAKIFRVSDKWVYYLITKAKEAGILFLTR